MDTPFYERLPGEVTILHAIQVPDLPDQKLKFPDGVEKVIGAGATACKQVHNVTVVNICTSNLSFVDSFFGREGF